MAAHTWRGVRWELSAEASYAKGDRCKDASWAECSDGKWPTFVSCCDCDLLNYSTLPSLVFDERQVKHFIQRPSYSLSRVRSAKTRSKKKHLLTFKTPQNELTDRRLPAVADAVQVSIDWGCRDLTCALITCNYCVVVL